MQRSKWQIQSTDKISLNEHGKELFDLLVLLEEREGVMVLA
jgi:hypothetical protein